MATKNPIGNYLKGEELESQPYFSKGISRRGFLKGAAGLAGAAIFGEGFLKQMEAWAEENGVSVYVNPKNLDEGLVMKLEGVLNRKGVKTTEYLKNADIEIRLGILYKEGDFDIKGGQTRNDSATVTVKYINSDGSSQSITYPKTNVDFLDSYIDSIGEDMANYLMEIRNGKKAPKKQSGCNLDVKEEEPIKIWADRKDLKDPSKKEYLLKILEKHNIKMKGIND